MSENPVMQQPEPPKDVPPVVPPSGRHIIQLFVVPGLIVFGIVAILWALSQFLSPWLFGVSRTPEQFLANLQSPNQDVRWRAASDLAQHLKRDDELAANVDFGLQLAELTSKALDDFEQSERSLAEAEKKFPGSQSQKDRQEMLAKRNYALYLCACLGNLNTGVGAPVLSDLAANGRGLDVKSNALLRRRAVWALANLGDNLKRFDQLPKSQQEKVVKKLEAVAEQNSGQKSVWASLVLESMQEDRPLGVISALAKCSDSSDIFLRNLTAVALTFWEGTEEENELAEKTLLKLSRDTGWGERIEVGEND